MRKMYFYYNHLLLIVLGLLPSVIASSSLSRSSFPPDFIFGAGSSAYQNEGGAKEGGKGPSIWDTFTHNYPDKVSDGSNGDVAADFYHRYKEDIRLMKDMNLDAIRISISWSRLLPNRFLDPLTKGDYPKSMRRLLGDQLPKFTKEQSKMIRNASFDFIGLNYYGAYLISPNPPEPDHIEGICILDFSHFVTIVDQEKGQPIFNRNDPNQHDLWKNIYPNHIHDMLRYVNRKYNHPLIYVMENGKEQFYNNETTVKEATHDNFRIDYIDKHLTWIRKSIKDGINVKGYFVWSFLDGFEWTKGHDIGVGINYVDYKDGYKRIPKLSALWFKNFLHRKVSFIDRFHYCH
ncbi:hypothetical protein ACFE04_007764 [Oxalis oulophora]